jgi:hypothetical protein
MPEDTLQFFNTICRCSPMILEQGLFTIQNGFATYRNHFMFDLTEHLMQRFIPMGIAQHIFDFNHWLIFRQYIEIESKEPQVLVMNDLGFGFVIWLIACGISTVGYFAEILKFKMRKPARTGIGLCLFLMLLHEQMQRYRM